MAEPVDPSIDEIARRRSFRADVAPPTVEHTFLVGLQFDGDRTHADVAHEAATGGPGSRPMNRISVTPWRGRTITGGSDTGGSFAPLDPMRSSADAPSAPRRTDFVEPNRQKGWKARLRCEAAANVSLIKEAARRVGSSSNAAHPGARTRSRIPIVTTRPRASGSNGSSSPDPLPIPSHQAPRGFVCGALLSLRHTWTGTMPEQPVEFSDPKRAKRCAFLPFRPREGLRARRAKANRHKPVGASERSAARLAH